MVSQFNGKTTGCRPVVRGSIPLGIVYTGLVQLADTLDLDSKACGFKSHNQYFITISCYDRQIKATIILPSIKVIYIRTNKKNIDQNNKFPLLDFLEDMIYELYHMIFLENLENIICE